MKVFMIAGGPLPDEKGLRNAEGLRSFQFLQILQKEKKEIFLITIENIKTNQKKDFLKKEKKFTHLKIDKNHPYLLKIIKKQFKAFSPQVLFGVNNFPSFIASFLADKKIPFWADLNGWVMAEGQCQANGFQNDFLLENLLKRERKIIQKADKFSVVSTPQKYALLGELAFMGRLNQKSFCYQFVEVIKNCSQKFKSDQLTTKNNKKILPFKKNKNTFVIIQIGGFNAWLDEKTMFEGVEKAMQKNPYIFFVTTGGALKGIAEKNFARFRCRVEQSIFKKNFIFLGWVKNEEIPLIYQEANCFLNIDYLCVETLCGARNRLTEALKFKQTIITTQGSEISEEIAKNKAGIVITSGNSEELKEAILKLLNNKELAKKLAQSAQKLFEQEYNLLKQMKSFQYWLKKPIKASKPLNFSYFNKIKVAWWFLRQKGIKNFIKKIYQIILYKINP